MTRTFAHSSTDGETPLEILLALAERARAMNRQWVVVGAAARDLVVHGPLGNAATRATTDVDIAIGVSRAEDLDDFTRGLLPLDAGTHKFSVLGVEVDIVPFGGVEVDGGVRFPDDHVLDVVGLQEAADHPDTVLLPSGVHIPVAPPELQVVLKLLAWRDRHHDTPKDALDLKTLLAAASDGIYEEEAWDDEDALAACDYTIDLAGAYRFGRQAASRFTAERGLPVLELLHSVDLN